MVTVIHFPQELKLLMECINLDPSQLVQYKSYSACLPTIIVEDFQYWWYNKNRLWICNLHHNERIPTLKYLPKWFWLPFSLFLPYSAIWCPPYIVFSLCVYVSLIQLRAVAVLALATSFLLMLFSPCFFTRLCSVPLVALLLPLMYYYPPVSVISNRRKRN